MNIYSRQLGMQDLKFSKKGWLFTFGCILRGNDDPSQESGENLQDRKAQGMQLWLSKWWEVQSDKEDGSLRKSRNKLTFRVSETWKC